MAAISLFTGWYQQPPYYYESFNGSLMLGCAKGQRAAHGNGGGTCNGGAHTIALRPHARRHRGPRRKGIREHHGPIPRPQAAKSRLRARRSYA